MKVKGPQGFQTAVTGIMSCYLTNTAFQTAWYLALTVKYE